ncbi:MULTISPECIES: hypothetical protein [Amycolatopsis]|uniref:hypothetical protein n=1 Tax=Amycolatopsis TaxID=1813 RepID=UPI001E43BC50|nr:MULTISPECIES: hypothetical protein [Amycolatopsis]
MWDEARERVEALCAARDADAEVAVMAGADPRLWLAVDASARRSVPAGWHRSVVLRALGRDGHLREAALPQLDQRIALPVLAIRAADWVPQVRERARRECLRHLFRDPMTVVDLFPLACRVRRRAEGEWLAATLEGMLRLPEVRSAALAASDVLTRRTVYESGYASAGELRAGLRDGDLKIRLGCARALAGSPDPEVLHLLRTSGTAALRALAIRDRAGAVAALADPASLVRAHAHLTLRRAGEDPARHYRSLLTAVNGTAAQVHAAAIAAGTPASHRSAPGPAPGTRANGSGSAGPGRRATHPRAAGVAPGAAGTPASHRPGPAAAADPVSAGLVAGLGETGDGADAVLLVPFLADGRAGVRAETVRALRRLRAIPLARAVPLLADPSPRVARQVMLALRETAALIDETVLHGMLAPGQPAHRRRIAFQLLSARDTWTRLALDLRLVLDPDEPLRDIAAGDLRNWFAYGAATTYTTPTTTQAAELRDLLNRAEPLLGTAHARVLRLFL